MVTGWDDVGDLHGVTHALRCLQGQMEAARTVKNRLPNEARHNELVGGQEES